MKTINSKLQKAGLETLTILTVVLATCLTISAQGAGFDNRFSDNEELASIEIIKTAKAVSMENIANTNMMHYADLIEEENESELTVETWMKDATYFGAAEMTTEIEEVLKVEDWMLDEVLFKADETEKSKEEPVSGKFVKEGKTIGLTFPGAQFGRRAFILIEMEDPKLELEQWMLDKNIWVRKM